MFNRRAKGQHYEAAAEKHLSACGLVLIERNFHTKSGELDLIMRDGPTTVFVEVRYRNSQAYGHAAETVTHHKAQKLYKAANIWLMKQGKSIYSTDIRFDVVAIHRQGQQVEWIKNAITQG
ncbi:YraN family protein [Vibrio hepatarius]|uniref:YraN family protein n=1 Tax=Vibrio hepatarius TaxID=171383 RepID=UPI00142E15E9|nr:YraN family protein [Vibrio hepatarius]NIY83531.1 YraN family protein [Vibrio hepatarius]NVJ57018.1 YraN family protein [Vibrionaceae bacterium]